MQFLIRQCESVMDKRDCALITGQFLIYGITIMNVIGHSLRPENEMGTILPPHLIGKLLQQFNKFFGLHRTAL